MDKLGDHWGMHLTLDLVDCCEDAIREYENIDNWVVTLADSIDMEMYGSPQIERFGYGDKLGYTCTQLIQTSNITAHFAEDVNSAFIDVFSCKSFDEDIVVEMCQNFFGGEVLNKTVTYRG